MCDNKLKHLEFIENVISRLSTKSFLIKGWAVTLVAAIFALAAKGADSRYVIITYLPICIFWALDGLFLSQERQYRELFKTVATKLENEIDFSMDASAYNIEGRTVFSCIFSKTLAPFYATLLFVAMIVMFAMPHLSTAR